MATEIKTEILIKAALEKVWNILTDFDNYPEWNPFIRSIQGNVQMENKIEVVILPPNSKERTFNPTILNFENQKELRWKGKLLIGGLFDGEHLFELIDHGDGTTTLKHSEKFSGLLVPLFKKQLENNTKIGFESMNQKIKELAEG